MPSQIYDNIVNMVNNLTIPSDEKLQAMLKSLTQERGNFEFQIKTGTYAATHTTAWLEITDTANIIKSANRFNVEYYDASNPNDIKSFIWKQELPVDPGDGSLAVKLTDTNVDYASHSFGSGVGLFSLLDDAVEANFRVWRNDNIDSPLNASETLSLRNASYQWTLSASGTANYYVELSGGGNPAIEEPYQVLINGAVAPRGTAGNLAAGEWDYANVDSLGYLTLYVRLSDDTDPDGKAADYIQATVTVISPVRWVDPAKPPHGGIGDGTTDDTAAILSADAAAGSGGVVYIRKGKTYAIKGSNSLNALYVIDNGGGLLADTGVQVSLRRYPSAGRYQIFFGDGTFVPEATCDVSYVTPEHFGAFGNDGGVDDTPGFQAAVDFAAYGDRRGHVRGNGVFYYLVGCVLSEKPVKISGVGERKTQFRQFSDTNHIFICNHSSAKTGVVFEDCMISGDPGSPSTTYDGLYGQRMELWHFHRVTFAYMRYGLHLNLLCRYGNMVNCTLGSGNVRGAQIDETCDDNIFCFSWIDENDAIGIRLGNASRNLFIGNRFLNNTGTHLYFGGGDGTNDSNIVALNIMRGGGAEQTNTAFRCFGGENLFALNFIDSDFQQTEIVISAGTDNHILLNYPQENINISDLGTDTRYMKLPGAGSYTLVGDNLVQTLTNKVLQAAELVGLTVHKGHLRSEFGGWGTLQNLLPHSEEIDLWDAGATANVTRNAGVAPDGSTTAERMQRSGGEATADMSQTITLAAAVANRSFRVTGWVKDNSATSDPLRVRLRSVGGVNETIFDGQTTFDGTNWTTFSFSGTAGAGNIDTQLRVYLNETTAGAVDVLVWGVQLVEAGADLPYVKTGRDALATPIFGVVANVLRVSQFLGAGIIRSLGGVNRTFTPSDGIIHQINPNGNVEYNPDSVPFPAWTFMIILNTAGSAQTITFDAGGLALAIAQGKMAIVWYDGTNWQGVAIP